MKKLFTLLLSAALTFALTPKISADQLNPGVVFVAAPAPMPAPEPKVIEMHITKNVFVPDATSEMKRKHMDIKQEHYLCSGAFIDDHGDIITARHCTEGADSIDVVTHDQQHYLSTIVSTSTTHDLAVIHIDRSNTPFFALAKTVSRGEKVYIIGSPLGITDTLSEGVVAKIDGDDTLLDCSVLPGNSGSTVFNEQGELIGVATAGFIVGFGVTHLNIAQSLDAVRFFLKTIK